MLKAIIKQNDLDEKLFPAKAIANSFGRLKDAMISPEEYASQPGDYRHNTMAKLYTNYQNALRSANAVDFDDILYLTVKLLKENPDVLEYYQRRYQYILVD